jgi:hypothetical protein
VVSRRRFNTACDGPLTIGNKIIFENAQKTQNKKLYSVKVIDKKKSAGQLANGQDKLDRNTPIAD